MTRHAHPKLRTGLRIAKWVALVAVLALGLAYLWSHRSELDRLWQLSAATLVLVLVARLAAYLTYTMAAYHVVKLSAPRLGFVEFLSVAAIASISNAVVLPGSAFATKTLYLKRAHGLAHTEFLSISALLATGSLGIAALAALTGLGLLAARASALDPVYWLLALVNLAAAVSLAALGARLPFGRRFARLAAFSTLFDRLLRDGAAMGRLFGLLIVRSVSSFLGFGVLFAALSTLAHGHLVGGVLDAVSIPLRLVMVLPGNFGLYEWTVGALAHGTGGAIAIGLAAAALYRIADLGVVGAIGLILLPTFRDRLAKVARQDAP